MKVLFVCVENACRSQMAEELFNIHANNSRAFSAGSNPASSINETTIQVLAEIGVDVSRKIPSNYEPHRNKEFDYIITMGCHETCPLSPKEKTIKWDIADPKGQDIEGFRRTREIIKNNIKELLRTIGD